MPKRRALLNLLRFNTSSTSGKRQLLRSLCCSPWFARSSSCTRKFLSCSILKKSYPGGRRVKLLKHRKDIPGICVCSTKAQTLSPGTYRSAHIESGSAQVFAFEPFLKYKYQEVMDYPNGPWCFPNVVRQRTSVGWFLGSSSSLRWHSFVRWATWWRSFIC